METLDTPAGGSVVSNPSNTQIPEEETLKEESGAPGLSRSSDGQVMLGLSSEVSFTRVLDNGVKVSVRKNEGLETAAVVGETRLGESQVSVAGDKSAAKVASLLDNNEDGGLDHEIPKDHSADEAVAAETPRTRNFLELYDKGKESEVLHDIAEKNFGLNVSSVSEDEKERAEVSIDREGSVQESSSRLNGGSSWKIEVSGNDIPLVVEVHGSTGGTNHDDGDEAKCFSFSTKNENPTPKLEVRERCNSDKKGLYKQNGDSLPENGEKQGAKVSEMPKSTIVMTKSTPIEEEEGKENIEVADEGREEENEEEMDDEHHKFRVGDFVWGKIKSHPWWPGRIYDPLDASKYAAKYHRRDRFLVAYFGDGTFAWCYPSQLKPFFQYFGSMSKQSNSGSFLNAVGNALDEFGRCIELEMTCSCIPKEADTELTRPSAVNAGIKGGVSVPNGGIHEFSVTQFEPAQFLAHLRNTAIAVSMTSMLELVILQSRLSAFYRAKGHHLPMYSEPEDVVDPEENAGNGNFDKSKFDVQSGDENGSPVEEGWLSSSVGLGTGETPLQRCPGISEDKLYHRKKQKSMVEILGVCMDVEPGNLDSHAAEVVTVSDKTASTLRKRKRSKGSEVGNGNDEAEQGPSVHTRSYSPSKKGRKRKLSQSLATIENKVSSVENDDDGSKGETGSEKKKGSVSRERKKSKYLSPPYTNLSRENKTSTSARGSESRKHRNTSNVGELMRRAADQIVSSPPIVKCSDEPSQKVSEESNIGCDGSYNIPQMPKQDQKMNVPEESNASTDKLLSQLHSVAINVLYVRVKKSFGPFMRFFSSFRSSVYHNGSDHEMYHKHMAGQAGRKKKSLEDKPSSLGDNLQVTIHSLAQGGSEQKKRKRKRKATSEGSKIEVNTGAAISGHVSSDRKRISNNEKANGGVSGAALLMTFVPGFLLPSRDNLNRVFGRFGKLNEFETEVFRDSGCARVVYLRSSDAEVAFNSLGSGSPFGPSTVSYRLQYPSVASAPRASELDYNSRQQMTTPHVEGCKTLVHSSASRLLDVEAPPPLASAPRASELDGNSRQQLTNPHVEGCKTLVDSSAPRLLDIEAPPLDLIRQNLEKMTTMLEKSGDKLSPEVKANLESEIKGLLKKVSIMVESSS